MPLLFLLTYIVLTYLMYKKNKDNVDKIPLIVKLNWFIGFALLFVYIVYYKWGDFYNLDWKMYAYWFYFLLLSYIVIFVYHLSNYRIAFLNSKIKNNRIENRGFIEKSIDNSYFILLLLVSFVFLIYSRPLNFQYNEWELFIYVFILLSAFYTLFENKIFYK